MVFNAGFPDCQLRNLGYNNIAIECDKVKLDLYRKLKEKVYPKALFPSLLVYHEEMKPARKDEILFTEKYRYVLGPFIARAANGDWLVTFNMSARREIGPYSSRRFLHPPYDPEYRNYMIRSRDAGKTWELPRVVPGYEWSGTEHVALCVLQNGDILASFYQRKYFP
ncbi:MAG: exo-alpha-sialidase, partial [Chloroflexi bacterium]|nr:exo-alpha-sialidase [Chloroflexota bacterium]